MVPCAFIRARSFEIPEVDTQVNYMSDFEGYKRYQRMVMWVRIGFWTGVIVLTCFVVLRLLEAVLKTFLESFR